MIETFLRGLNLLNLLTVQVREKRTSQTHLLVSSHESKNASLTCIPDFVIHWHTCKFVLFEHSRLVNCSRLVQMYQSWAIKMWLIPWNRLHFLQVPSENWLRKPSEKMKSDMWLFHLSASTVTWKHIHHDCSRKSYLMMYSSLEKIHCSQLPQKCLYN